MTFTQVALLTLLPTAPRDPALFQADIKDLKIEAYDLTVKNNKDGDPNPVGECHGLLGAQGEPITGPIDIIPRQTNPPSPPKLKTAILQHFKIQLPAPVIRPLSVATAVIVLNVDPSHSEFDSLDLRLVITRNGNSIGKSPPLEFNVPVRSIQEPLPTEPSTWIGLDYDSQNETDPVYRAGYVFVPPIPKIVSNRPNLKLGQDGITPNFNSLVDLVNEVLADDHTSTDPDPNTSLQTRKTPLDAPQCLQIARELIYDRAVYPLPGPKNKSLEDMYSNPNVASSDDQDRKQFEADINAYYSQHDAEATQLSNFVFAAASAIECEKSSIALSSASISFQIVSQPNQQPPFVSKAVIVKGVTSGTNPDSHLSPTFGIPAAFFYALGFSLPSQLNTQDRLTSAYIASEAANLKKLQAAVDGGIINKAESAKTSTDTLLKNLNIQQAARRIDALGPAPASLTTLQLNDDVSSLITDWLNYNGDSSNISAFWKAESTSQAAQYLHLVMSCIIAEKTALEKEITTALTISTVIQLAAVKDDAWRAFWMPAKSSPADTTPDDRAALLPNYTIPGSVKQRTEAFIRFLKTLFSVGEATHGADPPTTGDIQVLGRPAQDILQLFFNALPSFTFAAAIDDGAITTALDSLQVDDKLKAWAKQAIKTIGFLFTITTFQNTDKQTAPQQFSLIESLFARGFITPNRIAVLTKSQFHTALSGTVAYYPTSSGALISDLIYAIAYPLSTNVPSLGPEADDGFSPINPGNLVDCIPPKYLSPFSLNMYLKLLLLLMVTTKSTDQSVATVLQTRRGALNSLEVSPRNADVAVPLIDLANESLEALVEQVAAGTITGAAIFNTESPDITELGFPSLDMPFKLEEILSALPQHSSPHLPNPPTKAYDILKLDFSSPLLPYDQELDINRTYLNFLRTSRFEVMRTFRANITSFALDASKEPTDFRKTLWRYPVRPDIALEYLMISSVEKEYLFTRRLDASNIPGLYGYSSGDEGWLIDLSSLPNFLKRTGLSYCEFYEFWKTGFSDIQRSVPSLEALSFGQREQATAALWKIAVFIRLWRKVEGHYGGGKVSLKAFAAICQTLGLFTNDDINPDFTYQLASFFMLCDRFCLPMCVVERPASSSETAVQDLNYYLPVLGIWTDNLPDEGAPHAAIRLFLKGIECFAMSKYSCCARGAEFCKILSENLSDLSILFGFTRDIAWNAKPACTLRFAEILAKIYASPFSVGELIFLFTTNTQLEGDDPFPWTEPDESRVDPLNVPEDDRRYGLWSLRRELLHIHPEDTETECWSWERIVRTLRDDFDFKDHDALTKLAEHFFPHALHYSVPSHKRRFSTTLRSEDTSPHMWDSPPCQPFHYNDATSELWTEIPLTDEDVLRKLAHIRQLRDQSQDGGKSETKAIKELYFQPRAMLSPFAAILGELSEAIKRLVEESREEERFKFFQCQFAIFYKRCQVLAAHLAAHGSTYADSKCCGREEAFECERSKKLAWDIIKRLIADENLPGQTPWENDSGVSPGLDTFTWEPKLSGGAFAALLGLTGTGLVGDFQVAAAHSTWQEIRGPMSAFGCVLNRENVPVPMVIPNLLVQPTVEEQQVVHFRNGFVFDDITAENLGGAQSFKVKWQGLLLIENDGCYNFCVDRPRFDRKHGENKHHHRECDDHCDSAKWSVKLRRGQKHWTILGHGEPDHGHERDRLHDSVSLLHGAYEIEIHFEQPKAKWEEDERPDHIHTGFGVKYSGPDTEDCSIFIPAQNLYIKSKDGPLDIPREEQGGSAEDFVRKRYFSTIRDIRRTYQRAFKAFLFAHRFCLSTEPCGCCRSTSELDYMLDHEANFSGAAYYPGSSSSETLTTTTSSGQYLTHLANFDFNFLPVNDAYYPPDRNRDNRAGPSPQRSSAMFDWWERTYDYRCLSQEIERLKICYGPLWRLFFESSTQVATDTASLVRYLGVDLGLSSLTLTYFENKPVKSADLQDERWPIRIYHAWNVITTLKQVLSSKATHAALPDLWASNSPSTTLNHGDPAPQRTGNQNLIYVVTKSLLPDQETPRFESLKSLNDCLRLRAYNALVAYLCGLGRMSMNFLTTNSEESAPIAQDSSDLSALLLQDLDVGVCQTGTRIGEAISSIQKLVQRIKLGLEPQITLSNTFTKSWGANFGSYNLFQAYAKRVMYRENWIQWEELDAASQSDAAKFLKQSFSVRGLSVPNPSPPFVGAGNSLLPRTHGLDSTQSMVLARLGTSTNLEDEGISLMGTPYRSSQPTLLSSLASQPDSHTPGSSEDPGNGGGGTDVPRLMSLLPVSEDQPSIPLWFQAAVRLGTSFIRIAAAGLPPGMWHSWDEDDNSVSPVLCHCGKSHAPAVDEYYFWLEKGQYFDSADAVNDGTIGVVPPDPTTDWERPEKLPPLLHWQKHSQVYLHWTRVHYGEFSPPRRSTDSVPSNDGGDALSLTFSGRQLDSLLFNLFGGTTKGFRYDMATDSAVATPQVVPDTFPSTSGPAGLGAYPSFAYFSPGSPIFPVSTFGSALAISGSLRSQCKFDEALAWCKSVFDPLQRENTWAQCRREASVRMSMERFSSHNATELAENPRGGASIDKTCCPTSPVQVGIARGRAAVMEYIRILLQWGAKLHCLNTVESCKQALVVLDEAVRLLGSKPASINAKVSDSGILTTISTFVPASAPINPVLLELYEQVYDRRGLIYRCLGAQRLKQRSNPFNCSVNESIHEIDTCSCGIGQGPCCLPYKFTYLLAKSYELTSTVKALGQGLLMALEKGDSEYLSSLRQSQERQLNELTLSNKQNSYRESDWQVQALDQQLQGAQTRLRYNQQLIQNGLNEGENAFLSGTTVAMQSRTAGNISEGIGQGMSFIPDFTMGGAGFGGSPVAISKLPLGSKLAQVFQAAARIMNVIGDISNTNATIGSMTGGWNRRADDWQHQVDVITIELQQIKRQQLAAERRRDIALRDLNNHQLQIENSAEIDAFLADKFSKHDLYLFLQQETASLYRRTFGLAWQTVQEARESLKRERRDLVPQVNAALPAEIGPSGWNTLREGLMAGEKLDTGLRTLERMYMRETGCREYELGKFVSLRLSFPLAFLQLKMLGWCEFEIPEWMLDLDYPGHYLRRIKNVSVTIPCVVGPYVNVNCRLQLLGSSTRLEPTLSSVPNCCCKSSRKCIVPLEKRDPCSSNSWSPHCSKPSVSETCISAYEHNDSLSRDFLATEAIATSSGQNDSGVFELSFRDDKVRAPFEYAGVAASRWRVELPPRNNSFDLASLTDFVLHLNYTAKEGGPVLREVAERAAWMRLPGDGVRFIDVRSEFPTTWYSAFEEPHHEKKQRPGKKSDCREEKRHCGRRKDHCRRLPLQLSRRSFPFLTGKRDVIVTGVQLFIDATQPCKLGAHFPVEFMPRGGCPDDGKVFECRSSEHTPGFFHGELKNVRLGPLCGDQTEDLATLEFPEILGEACIRDVYFLCSYEAVDRECC
ncbi:insecticidal toxin complex protein [Pochonia chlamydosporia 170]|uniref:Insecticidal toxin complex protein n=1 Tax=Pochonia chlamydosporia 170 TaxID=1380566 RepID=A0A179GAW7_METCM|nr:insecticidal toxin complex protein [Pochonia chlamydosporia 170]OAQ74289.1 insecticidal toxin complex protein [Pochonia chlamydosporia 170]